MANGEKSWAIAAMLQQNPYGLAPMAGVTDMVFRGICKSFGCGLTYTEMVSAKGLHYGSERTGKLLSIGALEKPCGVQLFGSEPVILAETAQRLCDELGDSIALIDINMGCPAPKITSNGEGSALMREPLLASRIVEAVSRAAHVPVTVKIRKGWDEDCINALSFARMLECSGAAAICIHGRTRMQFYGGKADWDIIGEVKQAVSVPVIGNGDVFCAADALEMRKHTGCDGVLIARGAQGNPWIFGEIKHLARTGETLPLPTPHERMDVALEHARSLAEQNGEHAALQMRKHMAWYAKGIPGAAAFREAINHAQGMKMLEDAVARFRKTFR